MTRHEITPTQLRKQILAADPTWYTTARTTLVNLPAKPTSKQFDSLWGNIKTVYIELQGSKCVYCETLIEGNISNDIEHFRPKVKVVHWTPPDSFVTAGLVTTSPATAKGDPGYRNLAYHPWNYAASCKVCNSILKKNYFPICGRRQSKATNPRAMRGERALLIYPLGDGDDDPRELIGFEGMHPEPLGSPGTRNYYRALVTIEVFKLNNADERRGLYEARAFMLELLFTKLQQRQNSQTAAKKKDADEWIALLLKPKSPHSSCLNFFRKLYTRDEAKASSLVDDAKTLLMSRFKAT